MELSCISRSADETRSIGAHVARALIAGDVVVLSGDLGAGKTTFVQGAAEALGVAQHVTSPSFVLVREYRGNARVVHADVYRLNTLQELIDLGYEELFDDDTITFVEWGDAVSGLLPEDRLEVELRTRPDDRRNILIRADSELWGARGPALSAQLQDWAVPA